VETLILSIETSTVPFSVAVSNNDLVLSTIENHDRKKLASEITLMIESCCSQASISLNELSAIAISPGPGSYTGLRIGMSVAKGLCFALDIPLIFVSGLQSLALQAKKRYPDEVIKDTLFCSALDARRNEVYLEVYDEHLDQLVPSTPMVLPFELNTMIPDQYQRLICLGDGGEKLIGHLGSYSYVFYPVMSNASWMPPLAFEKFKKGSFESIETSEPFYLKPPNITTPKNKIL